MVAIVLQLCLNEPRSIPSAETTATMLLSAVSKT